MKVKMILPALTEAKVRSRHQVLALSSAWTRHTRGISAPTPPLTCKTNCREPQMVRPPDWWLFRCTSLPRDGHTRSPITIEKKAYTLRSAGCTSPRSRKRP